VIKSQWWFEIMSAAFAVLVVFTRAVQTSGYGLASRKVLSAKRMKMEALEKRIQKLEVDH
jgi:hypothetical protein